MPEPNYTSAEALAHDFEPGMRAGQRRYTSSKLYNIYTTHELARRLAESPDPRLKTLRVNAFDPGLMPGTGLARTYSAPLRFVSRFLLPALALFVSNVHKPATSGRRLASLASAAKEQRPADISPMGARCDRRLHRTTPATRWSCGPRAPE